MKVVPMDHFILMNENTIGVPSTVEASHVAHELTEAAWNHAAQRESLSSFIASKSRKWLPRVV